MTETLINPNLTHIAADRPDHYYRTEIPNIIFELLDPFQFVVYCHLKKITGDTGECWMNMKNLAKNCGMGMTKLRECLRDLDTQDKFIQGTSLINIIRRKKPDGSFESNIIYVIDIWRINGNFYRRNKNKIDASPKVVGVPCHGNEYTTQNDVKQEHIEEEPIEEQTTAKEEKKESSPSNPLFVCSSLEKEKMKILEKYNLNPKFLKFCLSFDIPRLQSACLAFDQCNQNQKLDNPLGFLRQALLNAWKPNPTKKDKIEAKKKEIDDLGEKISQNHKKALFLHKKYKKLFTNDLNFFVSDKCVYLKYPNKSFPVNLSENDCISYIEYYIQSYLLSKSNE